MPATRLATKYVEKPWGRTDLPAIFDDGSGRQIGEIWFDGPDGRHPPILVKYLFTSEKLSIQVHPTDAQAHERGLPGGKSECWYILDAQPGASLGMGTLRPIDADTLRAQALSGEIEETMDWKPVKPGDFFYIPAGTVHAIGPGLVLVEVQQNNDVTYRLYDYGRPRELHLDDGVAVSRAVPYPDPERNVPLGSDETLLTRARAPFDLGMVAWDAGHAHRVEAQMAWFIPIEGEGNIDGADWAGSQCWLIDGSAEISARKPTKALIARI